MNERKISLKLFYDKVAEGMFGGDGTDIPDF
jgi:hypothetical protein